MILFMIVYYFAFQKIRFKNYLKLENVDRLYKTRQ